MKSRVILLVLMTNLYISSFGISPIDKNKVDEFAQYAYATMSTTYNTYELCMRCIEKQIPGDFVECGVAAGTQVAVMGYVTQKYEPQKDSRKIHLFDSFQGIPLAGPNDDQQPGIGPITHNNNVENLDSLLVSSGITVHSLSSVQAHMNQWGINSGLLVYHVGWFQHVLPVDAPSIKKISILRLDGDLYESTKVCLEFLYPKISKGGFVIIDDYALTGCRKAVDEYLQRNNLNPEIVVIENGDGPVYWEVK